MIFCHFTWLVTPEWLAFPVGQRPPGPLHRAESEVFQPDRAHDEVDEPDARNNVVHLISLQLTIEPQPIAGEDEAAQNRMKDVVAESGLPNGGKTVCQPLHEACLA